MITIALNIAIIIASNLVIFFMLIPQIKIWTELICRSEIINMDTAEYKRKCRAMEISIGVYISIIILNCIVLGKTLYALNN